MQLVSVIIPCYNQGLFLEECIESVYKQTYSNIETIIINDGSDDQYTIDILEKIKTEYPKMKILSIKNSGVSIARNVGINNSRGEYILPLDGDDKIEYTYISKCIDVFNKKKDIDIVYCIGMCFGFKSGIYALDDFSELNMLKKNLVFCTAMYRKQDFKQSGGYNSNMIYGYEDWDFWLSIMELGKKFYRINEVLFYYRIKEVSRNANIYNYKEKEMKMLHQIMSNHENIYKKYNVKINYKDKKNTFFCKLSYVFQKVKLKYIIFKNSTNW